MTKSGHDLHSIFANSGFHWLTTSIVRRPCEVARISSGSIPCSSPKLFCVAIRITSLNGFQPFLDGDGGGGTLSSARSPLQWNRRVSL